MSQNSGAVLSLDCSLYDNFITLLDRLRAAKEPIQLTDYRVMKNHLVQWRNDSEKFVTSKLTAGHIQTIQLARLKRTPHYVRLQAFIDWYTDRIIEDATDKTVTERDSTEASRLTKIKDGTPKSPRKQSNFSKRRTPDDICFSDVTAPVRLITASDATELTYQIEVAKEIYCRIIGNESFKSMIDKSHHAQKAFLYEFVPLIFKPELREMLSDFVDILSQEQDLQSAAVLDGNKSLILKTLMGDGLWDLVPESIRDTFPRETEPMEDEIIQPFRNEDLSLAMSNQRKLLLKSEKASNFSDPKLLDNEDVCMACQFRAVFKRDPKFFIRSYERSLADERKRRGTSAGDHLAFYSIVYFLSTGLKFYFDVFGDQKAERIHDIVSETFTMVTNTVAKGIPDISTTTSKPNNTLFSSVALNETKTETNALVPPTELEKIRTPLQVSGDENDNIIDLSAFPGDYVEEATEVHQLVQSA